MSYKQQAWMPILVSVGPFKLEKLRKLGIVESADEYFERTTNTWLRETAKELEDEIIKVEKWKAFAIRQADGKVARLRKKLAEIKQIQPND